MVVPTTPSDAAIVAQIRANIVFEKLIVSVLTVAAAAGAAHFVIGVVWRASIVGATFGGVAAALFAAVAYAGFFFIAGFAVSLAVGIPLFRAMEKAKLRKGWPYLAAALAASFLILAVAGKAPSVEAPARLAHLLPGLAAALLFIRKMKPFWRAAERAEEAQASNVMRLN